METIETKTTDEGAIIVFGRSLFWAISGYKNESDFTHWAKNRIDRFALIDNLDFFKYKAKVGNDQSKNIQYDFTLDAAIRLAKTAKVNKEEAVNFLQLLKLPALEPATSIAVSAP